MFKVTNSLFQEVLSYLIWVQSLASFPFWEAVGGPLSLRLNPCGLAWPSGHHTGLYVGTPTLKRPFWGDDAPYDRVLLCPSSARDPSPTLKRTGAGPRIPAPVPSSPLPPAMLPALLLTALTSVPAPASATQLSWERLWWGAELQVGNQMPDSTSKNGNLSQTWTPPAFHSLAGWRCRHSDFPGGESPRSYV